MVYSFIEDGMIKRLRAGKILRFKYFVNSGTEAGENPVFNTAFLGFS